MLVLSLHNVKTNINLLRAITENCLVVKSRHDITFIAAKIRIELSAHW